ncbi:MAG: tRNA pseudouridine(38-40) synthase TruA [Bacteroidetes bacterium]|nr:tRNA pseudouridine(38-40) synthase TruA [Rhodothermia bacterium]MCS7154255.1 tRNA pseudouridine(38-40) synthase TruA [Bacteroidota bacterium]MCX7906709.1 tRNA pseudouridine(38-40) synthase TruA [Bacteroidota bacterium]MDW8137011.1 tRNA pseudouridine(38-40) synthase TruA [Bacteroidota bacterium]MDW8285118.1 tRNA pseudouridine(38-40) synthase TruA [Bacteroidota bacterium]
MPTYALRIEYDGTRYAGWQRQPRGISIQQLLEEALQVLVRESARVVGAGRTDAGVHAREQVAHVRLERPIGPRRLLAGLNGLLPRDVRLWAVAEAPPGFHARYSARRRTYRYYLSTAPSALDGHQSWFCPYPLDWDRLQEATAQLVGERDFGAFVKQGCAAASRRCFVYEASWHRHPLWPRRYYFEITANRFLRGMVRLLVGTLVQIGRGKLPPDAVRAYLAHPEQSRAIWAAPAHGLVLEAVEYEEELPWVYASASGL